MAGKPPWKFYALISGLYEFVVATFLIFHIAVAFVVCELVKYLPIARSCAPPIRRQHHLYCCGHFPPFSPCRACNGGREVSHSPSRISRGLLPGRAFSEDMPANKDGVESISGRDSGEVGRSTSLSSAYRRKAPLLIKECGPGCKGKCLASNGQFTDEFIEGSAEWLKQQKDRGNDEVILSLLKALQVECRNSRVLYEELEEERGAAETAANEAMSMILRLQEEKSALKLEAAHYQRLAEEKALHDEQAIQLLEEDLCRKDCERRLLEEELISLRRGPYADEAADVENKPVYTESSRPLLVLKGVEEATDQENGDLECPNGVSSQDTVTLKRHSAGDGDSVGCIEARPTMDKRLKRLKSLMALENGDMEDSDASDWAEEKVVTIASNQTEKCQALIEEEHDNADSLLVQLCALEKQLLALEESQSCSPPQELPNFTADFLWKGCDKVQHSEGLGQGCNVGASETFKASANSKSSECLKASENLEQEEVLITSGDTKASANLKALETLKASAQGKGADSAARNACFSDIIDDEKVVSIDVANINHSTLQEAHVPAIEDILDLDEAKRPKRKSVHWEASEVEKHLVLPSLVLSNHPDPVGTTTFTEACKLDDVQGLDRDTSPTWETNEVMASKRVTLEGINLRLQALENESTLLRHRSVSSSHEHTSMVLLTEIMQELQELLKSNRSTAAAPATAADEVLPQFGASVKGGQLKKRHYTN